MLLKPWQREERAMINGTILFILQRQREERAMINGTILFILQDNVSNFQEAIA